MLRISGQGCTILALYLAHYLALYLYLALALACTGLHCGPNLVILGGIVSGSQPCSRALHPAQDHG